MITETGRIVAVEAESLWVETVQQSSCSGCAAKSGCGQGLLSQWLSRPTRIRVLLQGRNADDYAVGDPVSIGVPESIVANGSLLVYLLPLAGLLLGAVIGQAWFSSEILSIVGGVSGLIGGGAMVRWYSYKTRFNPDLQPVLIDTAESVVVVDRC